MLICHQSSPVTFIFGQFHKRYLSNQSIKLVWKSLIKISFKSPRGQWIDPAIWTVKQTLNKLYRSYCNCIVNTSCAGVRCCFWLNSSTQIMFIFFFLLKSEIRLKSETAPHPSWCQYISEELGQNQSCGCPGSLCHKVSSSQVILYEIGMFLVSLRVNLKNI